MESFPQPIRILAGSKTESTMCEAGADFSPNITQLHVTFDVHKTSVIQVLRL